MRKISCKIKLILKTAMKFECIIYFCGVLEYAIHSGLLYKAYYKISFELFLTYLLVMLSFVNYIILRRAFYQIMRIRARL